MRTRLFVALVFFLGLSSQASGQGGIITTVAGTGAQGSAGDGSPAAAATLFGPYGVAVDAAGNLFIADCFNNRIRKVSAGGIITTIADSQAGYAGDGGPATAALLWSPCAVALDASGNLFIADQSNNVIRKISASGIIATVAGGGARLGDGAPATAAQLSSPSGVAVDAAGNLFIADSGNNRIRKVSASGIITTVAGSGASGFSLPGSGFSGDGGSATAALLSQPTGIAVDATGNLYIVDSYNNRVRKVSSGGIITTVAGSGAITGYTGGFSGDGGSATAAQLSRPYDVVLDAFGNLLVSDSLNNRIRKVSTSGIITTVAGGGTELGDGGPATSAVLSEPFGVAMDASGNLFVADFADGRVREVSATSASSGTLVAIPLPTAVNTVDVNPETNQVYVGGNIGNVVQNIVWIDGNTNTIVKSLGVGQGLHVNPATNKIYAADLYAGHILVYSGFDGSLLNTISTFGCPIEAVVDTLLDRIWGGGQCGGGNDPAFLIDGNTNALISGYIGSGGVMGGSMAVNPSTHAFYMSVGGVEKEVNASTLAVTNAPFSASVVAFNLLAASMYGPDSSGKNVVVINYGTESVVATLPVTQTGAIAVNPTRNRVYAVDLSVSPQAIKVFAGGSNTLIGSIPLRSGDQACCTMAVNSSSGTIYLPVTNSGSPYLLVINDTLTSSPPVSAPVLTSLSPSTAIAGTGAFTLTVNGSGFVSGSVVQWNGAALTTTFVSATQLTATVPASDLASAGVAEVNVNNPGLPTSDLLSFTIQASLGNLSITSISPSSATAGGSAFTLTVNGSGFPPTLNSLQGPVPGSVVQWNGTALQTTYISSTQLTATVPTSDLASVGTAQVTVANGASTPSNALTFTISQTSYTGCNGQPATGNLQLFVMSLNTTTGVVQINGVVSGASNTPFTWNWGDGATTQGFFPQSHTYSSVRMNYSLQVTTHQSDGSTDCAQLSIIFNSQTTLQITSVTTAFAGPAIAQNDFIVIKGANLVPANTPASGTIWSSAPSFASGLMPTQLGGVSVTVNNKPAFVEFFCSAATAPICPQDQLNILTPLDNTTGPVQVVVTSGGVSSPAYSVNMQPIAPSFLLFSDAGYIAATHANNIPVGATNLYPGLSTPAQAGETIVLYAVGFGLPTTTLVNGAATQSGSLPVLPVCTVGGTAAVVAYAGLISPGLYQLNLAIPATAANGDNAVSCTYGGSTTPAGDLITVQSGTPPNPTLTITTSGTGSGTVSSSPAGTACGSGCLSFAGGTVVTLTATTNTGSTFTGWSGACSGTASCTVTMNANLSVTAAFNLTGTIEITTQNIPAATGGTISLPGGSSVTFPPGALSADQVVTVSLLPTLPKQPPSGTIVGVGPALALSFAPAQSAAMGGNLTFQSHSIAAATSSTDTVMHIVPPNGQLPATVLGSAPVGDFSDATGGDNFAGLTGGVDPSGNTATFSASSLIVQGAQTLNVSLVNLSPRAFLPTYGPRVWNGSQWLPFPQGFDASKKTLVLTHGVLSSVESAYGGCVNSIQVAGGYQQVIGFDYDWTQQIDYGGGQLGAFLNQLQGQGVAQVDLEAHSFGTAVAMDAASMTSLRIGNMILEGGPIDGTPPASNEYLVTALAYISGLASESTIEDVLGGGMMMDVQSGSLVLDRIKSDFLARPNPTKVIKVVGAQSFFPGESALVFSGQPNDGLIPVSSASGADLPGTTLLYSGLTHMGLECSPAVISDVGAALASPGPPQFTLSVVIAGTGSGTVTATPPGFSYPAGTAVTLTASPNSQSTFAFWGSASGVCSGTGATCSFTVTADDIITANFNTKFTLTVAYAGTGSGAASASPSGPTYASGTVVSLSASPSSGSTFAGWSGACSGTGSCTVTMNSNLSVTATFNLMPQTFTLTVGYAGTGTGGVSASPPGPTYASGTVVTLSASPGSGSTFAGWSGACSGTGSCTVTMNSNVSVTATFNPTSTTGGSLPGTWSGNFTENAGGCPFAGTMSWSLTETGTTLTGSVTYNGTIQSTDPQIIDVCGSSASGMDTLVPPSSVSGNAVNLTGSVGETFTATVTGTTITGTSLYTGPNYNITWNYTLTKK